MLAKTDGTLNIGKNNTCYVHECTEKAVGWLVWDIGPEAGAHVAFCGAHMGKGSRKFVMPLPDDVPDTESDAWDE